MRLPSLREWPGLKACLAVLCCAVGCGVGRAWAAEDYSGRVGVMLGGGAYKLVGGEVDQTKVGPWGTIGLRYSFRRNWDIETAYRYGFSSDIAQVHRTRTTGVDLGLLYNGRPDASWTWQAFAGTGVLWWNAMRFDEGASSGPFASGATVTGFKSDGNFANLLSSNHKPYLGLGAEMGLSSQLTFRVGARIDWLARQHTDNSGASDTTGTNGNAAALDQKRRSVDANDFMPSVFGAVTWWFGHRDADGDGIPNNLDQCPNDPEDLDAFQDEDGCPDPDNDADTIADAQDKCPNEAEDVDQFEDEDGCPDPDNDGDGIIDAQDPCPNEAEDKDSFQDDDGCPDPDNDGDRVLDGADQCPDTPAGTQVDSTGCPIAKTVRERQLIETGMIRLSGVRFDTNKSDIKPEFAATLDSVAAVLANWPVLEIEIGGHTDARGSDAKNAQLAERRAQAVLDYLKSKNPSLQASRYRVHGYGESVPIADNATDDGRARNRRVEFRVMNPEELQAEIRRRSGQPEEGETPPPQAPAPETPPQPEPKKE